MRKEITLLWNEDKTITHVLMPIDWVNEWAAWPERMRKEVEVIERVQAHCGERLFDALADAGMCLSLRKEDQVFKTVEDLRRVAAEQPMEVIVVE